MLASLPNWPAPGPSESPAGRRSVPMSETNSASMPRSITGQQGSRKSWPYRARAASTSILKTLPARSGRRFCRCSIASRGCHCVASLQRRHPAPSRICYRLRCWRSCVEACCYAPTRLHQHRIRRRALRLLSAGDRPESSLRRNPLCEYIVDGLEKAPEAFIGILAGRNFGKALVRLS